VPAMCLIGFVGDAEWPVMARSANQWEFPNLVRCRGVQLSRALTPAGVVVRRPLARSGPGTRAPCDAA
jgi:hypothetical protein